MDKVKEEKIAEEEISVQRYMSGVVELWKGSKRVMKWPSESAFQAWLEIEDIKISFLKGLKI